MTTQQYIDNINQRYKLGNATEHTFRGDLQNLLEALVPTIRATNEPKRQSCGAPDYILTKKDIPVGFIEAKDIGDKDLEGAKKTGNKEQFDRYKASLNNLIFTDYLSFHLYRDGEFVTKITIAEIVPSPLDKLRTSNLPGEGIIKPITENFTSFENFIKDFCTQIGQTIKSSKRLAEMMASKARLLAEIIAKALTSDEERQEDSTLKDQMLAFKQILIHDITPQGFADVYAQTIAYGMFAARYHDPTLPTFSRQEAAELIPKSNPFLRKLFQYIAGFDLDDRIKWVVDDLVQIFLACDVQEMLKNYGKSTKMEDPIIHFYEDFLSEYDPKLRKARGVWYTPQPVVNFIVRAVDDILKTEFDLPQGLADTSRVTAPSPLGRAGEGFHRVQILDPATGTGTFLAEVVKHIHKKFKGQQGIWSNYVETHLLPRLNGFELLMASYAMAHLKLDLLLTETGYTPSDASLRGTKQSQRLRVYLTNSLEESHPDTGTLFANWLSTEANEANQIKRDTPVMCIIGNPPYNGESANKGEWIMKLMEDYKKEPGGKEKLKERNPKWINDDYVKFLRYGQHFIEKNGSGILAFINPHGFLDNPTFRGMRWNLLKTYDKIYTIDLHGNSKKKETAPDGSIDQNVFDIMQGVAITVFVKTGKKKANELGKIIHFDLFGKREMKYDFLTENSLKSINWKELNPQAPEYFFVLKDFDTKSVYDEGFAVNELFNINGVGLTTAHDDFVINEKKDKLLKFYQDFQNSPRNADFLHKEFNVNKKDGWNILQGYDNIKNEKDLSKFIQPISYRPFDNRYVFYEDKLVWRTVKKVMQHLIKGENVGLAGIRHNKEKDEIGYTSVFITKNIAEARLADRFITNIFPLYLYPEKNIQHSLDTPMGHDPLERVPNLNLEIVQQIADKLGLTFVPERHCEERSNLTNAAKDCFVPRSDSDDTFAPIDLLDYIYAVLHSPTYREKYKEFLKIDFPRVPYPKAPSPLERAGGEVFWQLVKLGGELRQIHLLESPQVEEYITQYPIDGNNVVGKIIFEKTSEILGKVYINYEKAPPSGVGGLQYFDNVPQVAWDFYIGGYQPAQKWLKDRKERKLEFEDILHYQKIIVALTETDRLMKEINKLEIE
jgi:predicted helicase